MKSLTGVTMRKKIKIGPRIDMILFIVAYKSTKVISNIKQKIPKQLKQYITMTTSEEKKVASITK